MTQFHPRLPNFSSHNSAKAMRVFILRAFSFLRRFCMRGQKSPKPYHLRIFSYTQMINLAEEKVISFAFFQLKRLLPFEDAGKSLKPSRSKKWPREAMLRHRAFKQTIFSNGVYSIKCT